MSGEWNYFGVARNTGTTDHFLQAHFPVLIRTMPNWISSESLTIQELSRSSSKEQPNA